MKIWIVGNQGLLGKSLARLLITKGIPFVGTGKEVDISHLQALKTFVKSPLGSDITHIINCAALTNVDKAEEEQENAWKINALGPENLGIIALEIHAYLIHISTDYVFDGSSQKPYTENDLCAPLNVYAKTKRAGEENLLSLYPKACIVRTSWLFGKEGKSFLSSLLSRLQTEEQLPVISDQKGRATFVDDLAQTLFHLLCHSGIYHFANQGEVSYYEIAKRVVEEARLCDIPLKCKEIIPVLSSTLKMRAKRPIYSVLCTKKIESVLGKPPRPWEETLQDYVKSHAL